MVFTIKYNVSYGLALKMIFIKLKAILLVSILLKFFKKILFIYFLERGEGREKERERSLNVLLPLTRSPLGTWHVTQLQIEPAPPLVHRPTLNPLSHTSQGSSEHFYH